MKPTIYDREILNACRAMWSGTANDGQQKRFMEWLVLNACHVGSLSFDEASDRVSAFRDGERHIGIQLVRMREQEGLKQLEAWEAIKPKPSVKPEARGKE